ncbi:MAG: J domain-containing protein [Haloarculaceae archaeon]
MAETFYSVLGVDPDADTEAIKRAYRELVKDHHPDVSDADDAALTFQRLTEARDVLVDPDSRGQYDSLGHVAYVRRHLDSNVWSAEEAGARSTGRSGAGASRSRGRSGTSRSHGTAGDDRSRTRDAEPGGSGSGNAENYTRYRSAYDPDAGRRDGNPFAEETGDSAWDDDGVDWTNTGWEGSDSSTADDDDRRERARADGWQAAHATATRYRTGDVDDATGGTGFEGVGDALRQVGPWLGVHLVFLTSAIVTVWLLLSLRPSVTTLLVSLVLLGFTVFFSILHIITQVYS